MLWTVPNILTVGRVIAAPCVALAFVAFDRPLADWIAFTIFTLAALTDFFDGWLARLLNQQSEFGRMLDPIADKAMVIIALAVVVAAFPPPGRNITEGYANLRWEVTVPAVVILLRETLISGLREFLKGAEVVRVTLLAKWKTAFQMLALSALIMATPLHVLALKEDYMTGTGIPPGWTAGTVVWGFGVGLLWVAALLTAITGWDYLTKGIAHIRKGERG